jgi:hypothetical protein
MHEIGQRVGIATPAIDALFGLRLVGRVHELYPAVELTASLATGRSRSQNRTSQCRDICDARHDAIY